MTRVSRLLSVFLAAALLLTGISPLALASLEKPQRLKIMEAVVQIWWLWPEKGGLRGASMGSGTFISADGLILTNHHVAFPDEELGVTHLGIALTTRSDRLPQPAFIATVAAADAYLDLAVLRVSHDLDLRPLQPANLKLPFVPIGDSDSLDVGDELNIFGYPGIGGSTVTFTRGVVSGFTLDAAIQGRAWIKTDTTIAGGNSGGAGVDGDGKLIGVPTRAGVGGKGQTVDCRPLADTNRDGKIDDKDTCVPVGGFLNALRPVNLAKPLIQVAQQGVAYQGRGSGSQQQGKAPAATGQPRFFNLYFAAGLTDSGEATSVVTSLPSGARSLYLLFDYENMTDGTPWEMQVQINGKDAPDWSMPAAAWSGGPAGAWWVGWNDVPFADGAYRMRFVVDKRQVAEAAITIGGQAQRGPTFSNIVFSQESTREGAPAEPRRLFPTGLKRLYWFFDYENMTRGVQWTYTWFYNGKVADTATMAWEGEAKGRMRNTLTSDQGLAAGSWRLELAIQGKLAARADFTVTGQQGGAALFEPFVFSHKVDQKTGKPLSVGTSFPSGIKALYVFSDYRGMKDGLKCVSRVYLNGQLVIESPFQWSGEFYGGVSGVWWNAIHANGNELPDGEYTQELLVEGQVVQRGSAVVGRAGQPAPTPTRAVDGVQVTGKITDADTGRPIVGAFFIVLQPGITVDAFQWTDAEVYTFAETDRQGAFKLPALLERGQCYSILMGAKGYWPHTEDDVCVAPAMPDQVELTIQLKRR